MDRSDLKRHMEEAEEQWLASIPNRPMLKSEKSVLRQLSEYGVGVHMQPDFPDRLDSFSLTSAGLEAALQLESWLSKRLSQS